MLYVEVLLKYRKMTNSLSDLFFYFKNLKRWEWNIFLIFKLPWFLPICIRGYKSIEYNFVFRVGFVLYYCSSNILNLNFSKYIFGHRIILIYIIFPTHIFSFRSFFVLFLFEHLMKWVKDLTLILAVVQKYCIIL